MSAFTSFDLSSFTSSLPFSFQSTICGDFVASSLTEIKFDEDEIDDYMMQEMRPSSAKQLYNYDGAYKLLETSQRMLIKQSFSKWNILVRAAKQQNQQKLIKGIIKLSLLFKKKIHFIVFKTFMKLCQVSIIINKDKQKLQKFCNLIDFINEKYYQRQNKTQGFNQIFKYSQNPFIVSSNSILKVMNNSKQTRMRDFLSKLKYHNRKIDMVNIFCESYDHLLRCKVNEIILDTFTLLKQNYFLNFNKSILQCHTQTDIPSLSNIESISPILNKYPLQNNTIDNSQKLSNTQISRQKQQFNQTQIGSTQELNKIINQVQYKNIDISFEINESVFLKIGALKQNNNFANSLRIQVKGGIIQLPRIENTLQKGLFLQNPTPNTLINIRPDQQYKTLNDQMDTNIIFINEKLRNKQQQKILKNSMSEYDLSKLGKNSSNNLIKKTKQLILSPKSKPYNFKLNRIPTQYKFTNQQNVQISQIRTLNHQKSVDTFLPLTPTTHKLAQKYRKNQFLHKLLDRKREQLKQQIIQKQSPKITRLYSLKSLPKFRQVKQF